jgi:hypothetical protein
MSHKTRNLVSGFSIFNAQVYKGTISKLAFIIFEVENIVKTHELKGG